MGRLAALLMCCFAVVQVPAAAAAVLVEGTLNGQALRLVVDGNRAAATTPAGRHLVDLRRGRVFREDGGTLRQLTDAGPQGEVNGYALDKWGPGPKLAGHISVYFILTDRERICAEILVSGWMLRFARGAVEAIALLERHVPELAPRALGPCGAIPFEGLARSGWPLMAGVEGQKLFETGTINLTYHPKPDEIGTIP